MLGWLDYGETGGGDGAHALMRDIAAALTAEGLALRGTIQTNLPGNGGHCDIVLTILGDGGSDLMISNDHGIHADSCRLDAGALETAVQRVLDGMDGADLVILNKFGRQESCGRGMIPVIVAAMDRGLPVLTAVSPAMRAAFLDFAGDMAQKLPPADAAAWCRAAAARRDA